MKTLILFLLLCFTGTVILAELGFADEPEKKGVFADEVRDFPIPGKAEGLSDLEKMQAREGQTVYEQEELVTITPHEQITIYNDGDIRDLHAYEIAIESDTVDRMSFPDNLPLDVQADLLFTEDFEGDFPGDWSVGDDNPESGEDYWDDLNCGYQNGNWSAWCADIGDMSDCNYYDDDMTAYMISQCVNVSGYDYVYLSYWLWYNTEPGYDFIRRYYSSDGQDWTLSSNNYSGTSTSSCNGGWIRKLYRLNNFNTYCMKFEFFSDESISHNYGGAYVDNIVILGSAQARPDPTIVTYWQSEDGIDLGQTFRISLYVNNDGGPSDDGAAILSFPSLTQEGDEDYVSLISGGGDVPGYQEYEHGDLIWLWNERQVPADYLTVQYEDNNWIQGEQNSFVVEVEPQEEGVFSIYVRANLGLWPVYFNEPLSANHCDQQGWPVERYSVSVGPTAVEESGPSDIPTDYELFSNHPNPFNAQTSIEYALPEAAYVEITIYNLSGQKVETLFNQHQQAGYHQITWDNSEFSSGVYFYRIQAREFIETKKMLLLK